MGDQVEGFTEFLDGLKPKAIGFLVYTKKGTENATDLARGGCADARNFGYGVIHDIKNKPEFVKEMHRLINAMEKDNLTDLQTISVTSENFEILVQCAVCAHQTRTSLSVLDGKNIIQVDSHEARLIDSLRSITVAFNLHQYPEILEAMPAIRRDFKTSKIKTYFRLLESLAEAYASWDDRLFPEALAKLQQTIKQLDENANDFGEMGVEHQRRLSSHIAFLDKLSGEDPVARFLFGTIDALCSGIRRYEKGDYIIGLLTLANSIEYSLRSRLLMKGYDIEKHDKLSRQLLEEFPKKAKDYLLSNSKLSVRKKTLQVDGDKMTAQVKPGFTYKPGFIDMLELLGFLKDVFFTKISPMIEDDSNSSFFTLKKLNILRNKVVHNMGSVDKNQVEEAIKLAENVVERFIDIVRSEYPEQLPSETREETTLQALKRQASHISLDYKALIGSLFSGV